jgi:hypothetical protein
LSADACSSRGVAFHVVEWRDRDRLLALVTRLRLLQSWSPQKKQTCQLQR